MSSNANHQVVKRFRNLPRFMRFFRNYRTVNTRLLSKGVPLRELLVLKYPLRLPDAPRPPALTVDFTDACDLRCRYCNNPLLPNPRSFMSDEVFATLCRRIEEAGINRVRVGGGEATLHPRLGYFLAELAKRVKFLSLTSNGQWKSPQIIADILASNLDMLEVSIDAGGAEYYERSRINAGYELLMNNLRLLHEERSRLRKKTIVKVRLMVRPSTKSREMQEIHFLEQFVDSVLPQYVLKHPDSDYDDDVFVPQHLAQGEFPQCSMVFKDMQVLMNGDVPLCQPKGSALGERIFLGNIMQSGILDLWNGPMMKRVRSAHRYRLPADMECCRGCNAT